MPNAQLCEIGFINLWMFLQLYGDFVSNFAKGQVLAAQLSGFEVGQIGFKASLTTYDQDRWRVI